MDGTVRTGADRCGQVRTGADRCGQVRARSKTGVAWRTLQLSHIHIYHMGRKREKNGEKWRKMQKTTKADRGQRRRTNAAGTHRSNTPRTHALCEAGCSW
eukprot:scaffold37560_cov48-Phaeocystis_antarctica.AAC.1